METVEVVIKIPKYRLDAIKWACKKMPPTENQDLADYVYRDIANGTVLPEISQKTKDHIMYLAEDYKCWDNHLSHEESLELCHLLEAIGNVKTDNNSTRTT